MPTSSRLIYLYSVITDIKQIDQADAPFTTINVGDLTAVSNCAECTANKAEKCSHTRTYEIRLGGDGNVRWGTLVIEPESTDPENPYANSTRLLGDVSGEGVINGSDTLAIVNYILKTATLSGESLQAADATDEGVVNGSDTLAIVNYILKQTSNVDGVKTIAQKSAYVAETETE